MITNKANPESITKDCMLPSLKALTSMPLACFFDLIFHDAKRYTKNNQQTVIIKIITIFILVSHLITLKIISLPPTTWKIHFRI